MMAGFQFIDQDHDDNGNGTLFQCAVNVGEVTNAMVPEHEIDNRVAFIAAGAIGLDGYSDDPQNWLYQRYFLGLVFLIFYYIQLMLKSHNSTTFGRRVNGDPKEMAYLISRFATGVIATMDLDNPKIKIVGMKPWAGVLFKVYWWMLVSHTTASI